MRTILIAATIALAPLGAANAAQQEVRVPVTSADLQSEESLAALVARIEKAADSVCKRMDSNTPLVAGVRQACVRDSVYEAILGAKIEPLTYYYTTSKGIALPRAMSATLAAR